MKKLFVEDLQKSDILLKRITADAAFLSKAIGFGQKAHVKLHLPMNISTYKKVTGIDPSQFSHAALALGPSEIMEFDEGSGIIDIMSFKGAGMVHTKQVSSLSHGGNEYVVFRPRNRELARRSWTKAISIKSFSEASKTTSYGIRKLLNSALFHKRGERITDKKIRNEMAKMKGERNSWLKTNRANFFCSHFVTFVYLWAANDMSKFEGGESINWVLGIDRSRISPAELAGRLLLKGTNFEVVGELKIG